MAAVTESYRPVEGGLECACCLAVTPWKRTMHHEAGCAMTKGLRGLTPRQLQVVLMRSRGLSNRDIAYETKMSVNTVESHLANASTRLGVSNLALITRMAVEWEQEEIAEGRAPKAFRGERAPGVMAGIG